MANQYTKQALRKLKAYEDLCDGEMPTRAAAKKLFKKTDMFTSIENARSFVRRIRQENGEANRKATEKSKIARPAKNKRVVCNNRFFNLVADADSHPNRTEPVHLNLKGKGAVINDVHLPYHDKTALATALQYIVDEREYTDFLLINGDLIDAYQSSRYCKNPMSRCLQSELQEAIELLIMLKGEFKRIIYKIGNHEKRIEDQLYSDAPQFAGMKCLSFEGLFRAHDIGIEIVQPQQVMYQGENLSIVHGHELAGGAYSPVNIAKGLMNKVKACGMVGHHHQSSEHSEKDIFGTIRATWSVGCLCELRPPYMPINNWNHGFALMECDGNEFHIENKRILKGKVY